MTFAPDLLSRHGFCVCGMTASAQAVGGSRPTPAQAFAQAQESQDSPNGIRERFHSFDGVR